MRQFLEIWSEVGNAPKARLRDRAYAALMEPMNRNGRQCQDRRNPTGGPAGNVDHLDNLAAVGIPGELDSA